MRAFIAICVAFVAFVSVNGDQASDQKALVAKITAMYANMSNADIKTHTEANIKAIENIMEAAVKQYVKDGLNLVATIDLNVIKYMNEGLPKLWAKMDKLEAKLRHVDYVQMGVISEVIKMMSVGEDKRRAANPIKVTDTADNLLKKYIVEYNKMLELTKWTVDQEKKKPALSLWADVHQNIYEYLAPGLKEVEEALKKLTKENQAKNLQVMLEDLKLLLKAVDSRGKTFSAKFTEKVQEIYSGIKHFFGKYF